jgi:glycosyltransferase involved in cell wall biosynthesis
MRVAWVVPGELVQPTGGYIYDRLVVEGLRARGDAVEVVSPGRASVSAFPWTEFDAVVGDALCAAELGAAFEHAAGSTRRVLLIHHLASWEIERADTDHLRTIEARVVAAADFLVVTGRATAGRLGCEYPGRAIEVIEPGADRLPRRARVTGDGRRFELLFVGSFIPRKRLPLLLDAVEALAHAPIAVRLVGDALRDPEHGRAIARRIADSPVLDARVTCCGVVDDESLAGCLAWADLLVLPSSLEGYGMALTEALASGLPVLAARDAARAAGIADSGAVLVFDDGPGLTSALSRFVADPSLRRRLQSAAQAWTRPRWADTVRSFGDLLRRGGLGRGGRAPGRAPAP